MRFFKSPKIILVATNLFVVVFVCFSFDGYEFYDDWHYIKSAHHLIQGTFNLDNTHFNARWGIIFPLALPIKIFGLHDTAIIALPLIYTLVTVNLTFWLIDQFEIGGTWLSKD